MALRGPFQPPGMTSRPRWSYAVLVGLQVLAVACVSNTSGTDKWEYVDPASTGTGSVARDALVMRFTVDTARRTITIRRVEVTNGVAQAPYLSTCEDGKTFVEGPPKLTETVVIIDESNWQCSIVGKTSRETLALHYRMADGQFSMEQARSYSDRPDITQFQRRRTR